MLRQLKKLTRIKLFMVFHNVISELSRQNKNNYNSTKFSVVYIYIHDIT